jgi:hypothetical protein
MSDGIDSPCGPATTSPYWRRRAFRLGCVADSLRMLSLLTLLIMLAGSWPVRAAPGDRPGVFLEGATVPRAKALALDAALIKGWRVADSQPDHVIFETWLEVPASGGPPNAVPPARTLLRVRADFVQTPAGVNTYLYAEEVWYAGSPQEWVANVTPQYRGNLTNALSSLQTQWGRIARSRPAVIAKPPVTGPAPVPTVRVEPMPGQTPIPPSTASRTLEPTAPAPRPPPPAEPAPDYKVGVWAYYAEQFAMARGCVLDNVGAVLVSGDTGSELHRVQCQDGNSLLVRCDREHCFSAR